MPDVAVSVARKDQDSELGPREISVRIDALRVHLIVVSLVIPGDYRAAVAVIRDLRAVLVPGFRADLHSVVLPGGDAVLIDLLGINVVVPVAVIEPRNARAAARSRGETYVRRPAGHGADRERRPRSRERCRPRRFAAHRRLRTRCAYPATRGSAARPSGTASRPALIAFGRVDGDAVRRPQGIAVGVHPLGIDVVLPGAVVRP